MNKRIAAALFLLALSMDAVAETQVNTDTLRLTFDSSGNLKSAFACFAFYAKSILITRSV